MKIPVQNPSSVPTISPHGSRLLPGSLMMCSLVILTILSGCATTKTDSGSQNWAPTEADLQVAHSKIQSLNTEIVQLKAEITLYLEDITRLREELEAAIHTRDQYRSEKEQLTRNVSQLSQELESSKSRKKELEDLLQRLSFALSVGSLPSAEDLDVDELSRNLWDSEIEIGQDEIETLKQLAIITPEPEMVRNLHPDKLAGRTGRTSNPAETIFQERQGDSFYLYDSRAYYATSEVIYPEIRIVPGGAANKEESLATLEFRLVLQLHTPMNGETLQVVEISPLDSWERGLPVIHQQLVTDGSQRLERLTFLVSGSLGENLLSQIISPGGRLAAKTASGGRVYLEPSDQGRSAFIELIRIFREKGGTF